MLGLKYVGGAILITGCLFYCLQTVREARQVERRLKAWIALLTYVRGQIACFGRPLSDILLTAEPGVLQALDIEPESGKALGEYCRTDAERLRSAGGETLKDLSEELGTVWREEQVERLDYYLAALQEAHGAYVAKLSDRLKVQCTMALCLAGGILLLVW